MVDIYWAVKLQGEYSPWRLSMVDIYWAVKLQGEYSPQATDTEVNSILMYTVGRT